MAGYLREGLTPEGARAALEVRRAKARPAKSDAEPAPANKSESEGEDQGRTYFLFTSGMCTR